MTTRTTPETAAPCRPERPRIYVACLAAYNAGHLHGRWIEAGEPEQVREGVRAMLAASPEPDAEEHSIHDYDGFEGCRISEWASFDLVCALADFIEQHGRLGAKLYGHFGESLDEARAALDNYAGEYRCLADFAEEITRETGTEIPKALEYYIDWAAMGRDLELNSDVFAITLGFDEVHVFWSR